MVTRSNESCIDLNLSRVSEIMKISMQKKPRGLIKYMVYHCRVVHRHYVST